MNNQGLLSNTEEIRDIMVLSVDILPCFLFSYVYGNGILRNNKQSIMGVQIYPSFGPPPFFFQFLGQIVGIDSLEIL